MLFKSGPSKEELKLRVARQSEDLKKMIEALSTLLGNEGVGAHIPHKKSLEVQRGS